MIGKSTSIYLKKAISSMNALDLEAAGTASCTVSQI